MFKTILVFVATLLVAVAASAQEAGMPYLPKDEPEELFLWEEICQLPDNYNPGRSDYDGAGPKEIVVVMPRSGTNRTGAGILVNCTESEVLSIRAESDSRSLKKRPVDVWQRNHDVWNNPYFKDDPFVDKYFLMNFNLAMRPDNGLISDDKPECLFALQVTVRDWDKEKKKLEMFADICRIATYSIVSADPEDFEDLEGG